MKFLFIPVV